MGFQFDFKKLWIPILFLDILFVFFSIRLLIQYHSYMNGQPSYASLKTIYGTIISDKRAPPKPYNRRHDGIYIQTNDGNMNIYCDNPQRGQHPNSTGYYSYTSLAPMMNFFPFAQIETISPRPMLFIVGENAVSKYFSEDAYAKAAEPKELFVVPGATHVDLYDQPKYLKITLPKLDSFFKQHLK